MRYDPRAAGVPRNPIIPLPDAPIAYPIEEEREAEEEVYAPAGPPEPFQPAEPLAPGV